MTPKKDQGTAIKVIEPFIVLGKVFGVNKFNFKEQRISHVSPISIVLSLVVLIAMLYIIQEDINENAHNIRFYEYIIYFLGIWSPLQYILISALTFFLRIGLSEKLFLKFELICNAFGSKFNMAAQRKKNGVAVVLIISHFVIKISVSAVSYGCWTALLLSHYSLMQMLEEEELCCFFALVRVLRCELQRLRSEVKSCYAREAFVSTTGDKSMNEFIEVHGNIMESYNILTELYSSQFLLSLSASLVSCLITIQILIEDFLKSEVPSVLQVLALVYWFLRVVVRLFLISTGCSWFQTEANDFKKTLVDILVNGRSENRGEVAALLSVVHSADRSKTTVYRLFALDNALPFQFLSLLATYTIILIQFANM